MSFSRQEPPPEIVANVSTRLSPAQAWPGEWEVLASRIDGPATFASRAWTAAWLDAFAPAAETRAIELRHGERLVGTMWLYRHSDPCCGTRWLTVGSGNSDHLDPLLDREYAERAARTLIDVLVRLSDSLPVELQQISATSPVAQSASHNARCEITPQDSCLFLDIDGVDRGDQLLKKGMRYDLRRSRQLVRQHGGSIEDADHETRAGLIDALIDVHTSRWRERGTTGVLADPATRALHHAMARSLSDSELVLRALRVRNEVVACIYGFRSNGSELCYISGFDPDWSWLQPGKLLLADAIDHAIAKHLQRFDMLRGQEEYKYRWPVREQKCVRIRIGSNDEKAGRSLDHRGRE